MKKISLLLFSLLFSVNTTSAGDNIDAAVKDICDCGYPPSGQCINALAEKYPEINQRRDLQDLVMSKAQKTCGPGNSDIGKAIQDLTGNPNLNLSALTGGISDALEGIAGAVAVTTDCSTQSFNVDIPDDWQCRKQKKGAYDVSLYNQGNKINVSLGVNQGKTSCSVLPVCSSEDFVLSENFDTTLFKNPMAGTYEYSGAYKKDNSFKLTITSPEKPTEAQIGQIAEILNSFESR